MDICVVCSRYYKTEYKTEFHLHRTVLVFLKSDPIVKTFVGDREWLIFLLFILALTEGP